MSDDQQLQADVQAALASSMLQRVPDLVIGLLAEQPGLTPEAALPQALELARQQEERLCLMLIAPSGPWQQEIRDLVRDYLCRRVYATLRAQPFTPMTNPRWLACAAALGHEPTVLEFLCWHQTP